MSKTFKFIEFILIFMGGVAGIFTLWLILYIFEVISAPGAFGVDYAGFWVGFIKINIKFVKVAN